MKTIYESYHVKAALICFVLFSSHSRMENAVFKNKSIAEINAIREASEAEIQVRYSYEFITPSHPCSPCGSSLPRWPLTTSTTLRARSNRGEAV